MSGRQAEDKSGNRGWTARNDGTDSINGGSALPVPQLISKTQGTGTGVGNSTGKGKATVPAPQGTDALKDWEDFFAPVEEDSGCKDGVCPVPWAKGVEAIASSKFLSEDRNSNFPGENTIKEQGIIQPDLVNHPPHYASGAIECIEAIEAQLTPEEYRGYLKGNCVKYQWRERQKGGLESLKKAQWYLNRLIELDESTQKG